MNKVFVFLLSMSLLSCSNSPQIMEADTHKDHEIFTKLLSQYVREDKVDYQGLKADSLLLNNYLSQISNNSPTPSWSKDEKLAYWINAYNANTLKLIIDNYPIESITDLHPAVYIPMFNTVWHRKFFKIGGIEMSLDEIEHEILRKDFDEPRIHFAINCASISCPVLRNEAFEANSLNMQLEDQAKKFINDPKRNMITKSTVRISKIFKWFASDFEKQGTLIDYLNKYSSIELDGNANIDYLEYNWDLNDLE